MEYDMDYVKKYGEDLDTTLIPLFFTPAANPTRSHRRVHFLPSAPPSSSIFIRNLGPTLTSSPLCHPLHPRPLGCPTCSRRSTQRDRHHHRAHIRETSNIAAFRVHRNVRQTVTQLLPVERGGMGGW